MPSPEISIIMPLYNSAAYVREAIGSILGQSFRDFELIVIDDGSADAGPDIVRAFTDERIRFLTGFPNAGPAAARNRGLAAARGRRIAFFDSDDIALPGMLGCMAAESAYEIVTGWCEEIDEAGRLRRAANRSAIPPEKLAPTMLFRNCIPTSALLINRECLEGQRFDEGLELASDYDMWARLMAGRKALQIPWVLTRYRSHSQNISHRKKALAANCLEQIFRRQLARLGIEPAPEELDLHARLTAFTFGTPRDTVLAVERWLLKLDTANANAQLYPIQPFRETLGERWYHACHSAGCNGLWTWRAFFASPLCEWNSPSLRLRCELLRLSARGAVRNLLQLS